MSKSYLVCPNCEKSLERETKYCSNCGQYQSEHISVGLLFRNAIGNFVSADSRLFKSIGPLIFKPGKLERTFISGKRKTYLHPGKFYFFASFIFFFFVSMATDNWEYKVSKFIDASGPQVAQQIGDSLKSVAVKTGQKELNKVKEGLDSGIHNTAQKLGGTVGTVVQNSLGKMDSSSNKAIQHLGDSIEVVANELKNQGKEKITEGKDSINNLFDNLARSKTTIDTMRAHGRSDKEIYSKFGVKEGDSVFKKLLIQKAVKFIEKSGLGLVSLIMKAIPFALFLMIPVFALLAKVLFFRKRSYAESLVFSLYQFSFQFLLFTMTLLCFTRMANMEWAFVLAILISFIYLVVAVRRFYEKGWISAIVGSGIISVLYSLLVIPFTGFLIIATLFALY